MSMTIKERIDATKAKIATNAFIAELLSFNVEQYVIDIVVNWDIDERDDILEHVKLKKKFYFEQN